MRCKIIFGNPWGADTELTIRNIPLHAGIESRTAPQVDTAPALIYAYALQFRARLKHLDVSL